MDTDVISDALRLGIKHFQAQDYQKALKVFSKAIDLAKSYTKSALPKGHTVHPKLCTLLDSRAAVYEKLGNLRHAGRDGEEIIAIDPLNCKGYLRVCKILLVLDAKTDAYKVLSKGYKKIGDAMKEGLITKRSPLFEQIAVQKQSLSHSLKNDFAAKNKKRLASSLISPSASQETQPAQLAAQELIPTKKLKMGSDMDPSSRLPLEVFVRIISLIPFQARFPKLLLVNHTWYAAISSVPELWSDIEFRYPISSTSCKKLYNKLVAANHYRAHKRIDQMKLVPRTGDEKSVLNTILNLGKLQLIDFQISLQDINLRDLTLAVDASKLARYNLSNLQSLKIDCEVYLSFETFLLDLLPNLQKLEIICHGTKRATNIMEKENDSAMLQSFNDKFPSTRYDKLIHLAIICSSTNDPSTIRLPFKKALLEGKLNNLQKLIIAGFKIDNHSILNLPQLREIILEKNTGISAADVLTQLSPSLERQLHTLYMREDDKMSSTTARIQRDLSLSYLASLTTLDLTGSSIQFDDLCHLLKATKGNVETLFIGGCRNLVWPASMFDMRQRNSSRNSTSRFVLFDDILQLCPNLCKLSLNQSTNFTDFSLIQIGDTILNNFAHYKLDMLDLSFNNISGHGLVEFFGMTKVPDRIKVTRLIVDGNDIKTETLKLLNQRKYIQDVQYEFGKKSWRQFGINSFSLS